MEILNSMRVMGGMITKATFALRERVHTGIWRQYHNKNNSLHLLYHIKRSHLKYPQLVILSAFHRQFITSGL